jgi:DNA-binding MarR family transcriptional regulator
MRNVSKDGSLRTEAIALGRLLLDIGRKRGLRDPLSSHIEAEFTPAQIHSLVWLGFDGPLTMGELARRCGITEKTITGLVDRMERLGMLQRERDLGDRRVVHVQLLPEGECAFRKLRDGMVAKLSRMLAMLDPDDRKGLLRIFEKLRDRVAQGAPEDGARQAGGGSQEGT